MTSPTSHPLASLAQKMGGGSGLLTAWCGMTDPIMAGLLAREFDTVTLDMQHGCYDIASITNSVAHVSAAGKPAIVRIPVGQFAIASRVLDLGASAVIAPMINSVDDAKAFASFMKYPPIGERSWGPAIPLNMTGIPMGDYLKQANKFSIALAMIETRAAIDALAHFLARAEHGNDLFVNGNMRARARVAADAGVSFLDGKCSETPDFHPVASRQRIGDLVENGVHDVLGITLIEFGIVIGDFLNELGLDHTGP